MKRDAAAHAIRHIGREDLKPGALWRLFENGANALCLHDDARISELWGRVVNNDSPEESGSSGWKGFWNNGVLTFAKNHIQTTTDYGDLFWFEPEAYGYIARKVVTFPDPATGRMQVFPKTLQNDNGENAHLAQETLKLAWDLAMDILKCSLPNEDLETSAYVVHLELLKYPDSHQDHQRMLSLVNTGSAWKRVGVKLDRARVRARGPFATRFIRDGYAWLSILPWIGERVQKLNQTLGRPGFHEMDAGLAPVGEAHVDGCRFLTIIASDRDVMTTEAYCDGKWMELPMSSDSFVIFPGSFLILRTGLSRLSIATQSTKKLPKRFRAAKI